MRPDPAADATGRVAGPVDATLDGAVVLLATWTVVYHASLVLGTGSTPALAAEVVLVLAILVWRRTRRRPVSPASPGGPGRPAPTRQVMALAGLTTGAAVLTAAAMALDLPWGLVCAGWMVAALAGIAAAALRLGAPVPRHPSTGVEAGGVFAVACAVALAAFATVTLRPNPDDLFYVNLSQWVAATGDFPVRDTLFGDLVYPMSNWPPIASYDAVTGAVAHLLGVRAGDVVYLAVPPLATALSVLALWRLLRAWRVPHVVVALAAALLFLLVDGTVSYGTPGNLFLTRLWQGKVILLCLVVPIVLVYALEYVEQPRRERAGRLLLAGTAAVGCSTTAIFLVPVLALAGCAPLLRRDPGRALAGFLALAAYPLGAGLLTLGVGGRSADEFGERRQYRFDPSWFGHEVFLTGIPALVAVLAVLLGCLLVPHPAARLTSAVANLCVGVVLLPGVTHLAYDAVGLGPTLWRLTWGCTVAALVGVLASFLWSRAPSGLPRGLGAAAAAAVLVVGGSPIWASDTSTSLVAPPHWQRGEDGRDIAAWAIDWTERSGGLILAPDGLSITVAVTTTEVKTVAPRDYYLAYLRDEPGFHYDERLRLVDFANRVPGRREDIGSALRTLDVAVACVYRDDLRGEALLRASGYRFVRSSETYRCAVG